MESVAEVKTDFPDPDQKKPLHMVNNKENADISNIPVFRRDVKSIITYLNNLDIFLEQNTPEELPFYAILNRSFTSIRAIECVLGQINSEELQVLSQKITRLEIKMQQTLNSVKEAKSKGKNIDDFTIIWLEKKGPDILHSVLRNLEKKVK